MSIKEKTLSTDNHSMINCNDINHVRQLWEHEDNLINQRMTWLGITQSLLFTAYGVLLTRNLSKGSELAATVSELEFIIPIIGVATSALILLGIVAAVLAMKHIKDTCKLNCLGITNYTTYMGLGCGAGLPIVFIFSWLYILLG